MTPPASAMVAYSNPERRTAHSKPSETDSAGGFTISDLARDFDVTLRTLRFYEARGLLSPARSGMTRIYSERDRSRLALILKGKQLGFTLVEIRAMLAKEEKKGAARGAMAIGGLHLTGEQIREQLDMLRTQRAELDAAIAELEATRPAASKA